MRAYYAITDPAMRGSIRKLTQAAAKLGQSSVAGRRRAPPDQAIEFDRSKIDGRTKVGKAALVVLKRRGRKSKADLEALAGRGLSGLIDLAHTEPVAEVKDKLPVVVVMAIDEYERLKTLDTADSLKRK